MFHPGAAWISNRAEMKRCDDLVVRNYLKVRVASKLL
jgi:hypothetical protein